MPSSTFHSRLRRNRPPLTAIVVNRPSRSAFELRRALGRNARVVRAARLPVVARRYSRIINWGCSELGMPVTFNSPEAVGVAVNKLRFAVRNARKPWLVPSTPYKATAAAWLEQRGAKVMCRTKLTGHSGDGIVVARSVEELVDAPLYTLYIKKQGEYRAHVFDGRVICLQQKRKRDGVVDYDPLIRSASRGWVYAVNNVNRDILPSNWEEYVVDAVESCGLEFGAVDFIIDQNNGVLYVLEVNTAPGLCSPTVAAAYIQAFAT